MKRHSRLYRLLVPPLVTVLLVVLTLEGLLRLVDPWGAHYFDDLSTLWDNIVTDPHRGTVLPPGVYQFANWTAVQDDRSVRHLPASAHGPCKVLLVGDSLTWGHGVNDGDTWANLLAGQLPQADILNAGQDGYNSENTRGTIRDFPDADVIVYLIIGNDAEPTIGVHTQRRVSMIKKYLTYFTEVMIKKPPVVSAAEVSDTSRFLSDLAVIHQDDRVVLVSFEPQSLIPSAVAVQYRVNFIPLYHHPISRIDGHPNPDGNKEIAASMLPIVRRAIDARCGNVF